LVKTHIAGKMNPFQFGNRKRIGQPHETVLEDTDKTPSQPPVKRQKRKYKELKQNTAREPFQFTLDPEKMDFSLWDKQRQQK
jgi:hypothetical protein